MAPSNKLGSRAREPEAEAGPAAEMATVDGNAEVGGCEGCGTADYPNLLLLCDNCDSEHHTYCLDPPLDSVPSGSWFCPRCDPEVVGGGAASSGDGSSGAGKSSAKGSSRSHKAATPAGVNRSGPKATPPASQPVSKRDSGAKPAAKPAAPKPAAKLAVKPSRQDAEKRARLTAAAAATAAVLEDGNEKPAPSDAAATGGAAGEAAAAGAGAAPETAGAASAADGTAAAAHVVDDGASAVPGSTSSAGGRLYVTLGDDGHKDTCKQCGAGRKNGELSLCDGCTSAYHYRCLPSSQSRSILQFQDPGDEWFCPPCVNRGKTNTAGGKQLSRSMLSEAEARSKRMAEASASGGGSHRGCS